MLSVWQDCLFSGVVPKSATTTESNSLQVCACVMQPNEYNRLPSKFFYFCLKISNSASKSRNMNLELSLVHPYCYRTCMHMKGNRILAQHHFLLFLVLYCLMGDNSLFLTTFKLIQTETTYFVMAKFQILALWSEP